MSLPQSFTILVGYFYYLRVLLNVCFLYVISLEYCNISYLGCIGFILESHFSCTSVFPHVTEAIHGCSSDSFP